ncbi:MAG: sulfite exporter TauE/SafE family protein [Rhodobacteraceae bacterium]|nr:sulfite exporter TauE/SafE family protein [Paracoccaceae bacterium]
MLSLLLLGLMIGIAHAFESDHLAAVSALISGQTRRGRMLKHGALWGIGHTATLFTVGGFVLLTQATISPRLALGLEGVVGVMLIWLGAHVLYRLYRDRVHFHSHAHGDGTRHLHLHSHRDDTSPHEPARHRHAHPDRAALRTLAVGMMHGMAGSAALVLVASATMASPLTGLSYILAFGLGSVIGMAAMSLAIAIPLSYTAKALTRINGAMQAAIGAITIGVGLLTLIESTAALAG